jgi:hypothetical protein
MADDLRHVPGGRLWAGNRVQAVCPRCGSTAEVRTVQDLFDMLNSMQNDVM